MSLARLLLLALLLPAFARADEKIALLQPGEALTYRVSWGLLGQIGEMKISASAETVDGKESIRVNTTSATRGFVRTFYPFDGSAWTLFDAGTGRLLSGAATTKTSKKSTSASILFDYVKGEAVYTDHLRAKRSATLPLPDDAAPVDLITSLIQGRIWELQPGQSREALVLFDDEFYPLLITAEREETLSTASGPRKAILLVPTMPENPKGMFKRGGEVKVWVSADKDRLPLRFEVKLKVGTAYATLSHYDPPSTAY